MVRLLVSQWMLSDLLLGMVNEEDGARMCQQESRAAGVFSEKSSAGESKAKRSHGAPSNLYAESRMGCRYLMYPSDD